jgi:hypothetical protein
MPSSGEILQCISLFPSRASLQTENTLPAVASMLLALEKDVEENRVSKVSRTFGCHCAFAPPEGKADIMRINKLMSSVRLT